MVIEILLVVFHGADPVEIDLTQFCHVVVKVTLLHQIIFYLRYDFNLIHDFAMNIILVPICCSFTRNSGKNTASKIKGWSYALGGGEEAYIAITRVSRHNTRCQRTQLTCFFTHQHLMCLNILSIYKPF